MTLAETIPDDPVHVCVLEDEAFIGEEICDEIQEHCPHGSARVFLTDNLEAARTAYREGPQRLAPARWGRSGPPRGDQGERTVCPKYRAYGVPRQVREDKEEATRRYRAR